MITGIARSTTCKPQSEEPLGLLGQLRRLHQLEREQIVGELVHQVESPLSGALELGVHPQHKQARQRAVGAAASRWGSSVPPSVDTPHPFGRRYSVAAPGSERGRNQIISGLGAA